MLRDWKFGGLLIANVLLALILTAASSEAAQAYCGPCYKGWFEGGVMHAGTYHEGEMMVEEDPGTDAVHAYLVGGSCFDSPEHFHICCDPGGGTVE